jgi:hypothetical protein
MSAKPLENVSITIYNDGIANEIAEYRDEVAEGRFHLERCKVTDSVRMSKEEYAEFCNSLMTDRDWLAGKGGTDTTANLPRVEHWWQYTGEQQKEFRMHAYRLVLSVSAPDRPTIYIDPQGYQYARYVGI